MAVGIEIRARSVRHLTVTERGEVVARSDQALGKDAIPDAIRRALNAANGGMPAGVAMPWLGGPPADVTSVLRDSPKSPTTIGTGAATAMAEAWCGAARGLQDVVAFGIDDHIVAGVIVGGLILRGANGLAGAVEWLSLNPVERADYRRYGGLAAEVSPAGIVRRAVWRIKSGDRSAIEDAVHGDLSRITADHVLTAAQGGDGVSISVVRDTARYVGMAVSNLAAMLDPQAIVLGGMLAGSGAMMLDSIKLECSRRLAPVQAGRVSVVLSTLGDDAAAIGAARAALLEHQ